MLNSTEQGRGIIAPILTPFNDDLSIATDLYAAHAQRMLDEGCVGLTAFDITGEAASVGKDERINTLWSVTQAGIDPSKILAGTGLCTISETADLTRACLDLGCGGTLIMPPFFFKNAPEDGLYAYFEQIIARVGDDLRAYLHHAPEFTGVGLSVPLMRRLRADFPDQIIGIKDCSGDWTRLQALIAIEGLAVYSSSEATALQAIEAGAAGCISATANVNAPAICAMLSAREAGNSMDEAYLLGSIEVVREAMEQRGFIEIPKRYLALKSGDSRWANVRPPLLQATAEAGKNLAEKIDMAI